MTPPATPSSSDRAVIVEGAVQALIAGFVDTCGFVALFGLFTAHVTGNLVLIGAAIADYRGGLAAKLLALPVFMLAVVLCRAATLALQGRGKNPAVPLLGLQLLLLAGFMAAGIAATPISDGDAPLAIAAGMLGVAAMAIQNTLSRTLFAGHAPTTVMTGNVTQLVIDLADLVLGHAEPGHRARLAKMAPAVLAFTGGALFGAVGYTLTGFWCLAMPIAALALLLVREARRPILLSAPRR